MRRKLAKEAAGLSLWQVAVLCIGLVNTVLVARTLGPEGKGLLAMSLMLPLLLESLGNFGVADALIYYSAESRGRPGVVVAGGLWSVLAGAVYTVILLVSADALSRSLLLGIPGWVIRIGALTTLPGMIRVNIGSLMIARGKSGLYSLVNVALSLAQLTLNAVVIIRAGSSIRGVALAGLAAYVISACLAIVLLVPVTRGLALQWPTRDDWISLLRYGRGVFASNLAQKLNYRLDMFLMNAFMGAASVGVYSVATRVAEVFLVVPRSLRMIWHREVSAEAASRGVSRTEQMIGVLFAGVILTAPLYGLAAALGVPLVFGAEYASSSMPLLLLMPGVAALAVSMPLMGAIAGQGSPERLAVASWVALGATVALDIALIPAYGLPGAAVASSLAYTVYFAALWLIWVKANAPLGAVLSTTQRVLVTQTAIGVRGILRSLRGGLK